MKKGLFVLIFLLVLMNGCTKSLPSFDDHQPRSRLEDPCTGTFRSELVGDVLFDAESMKFLCYADFATKTRDLRVCDTMEQKGFSKDKCFSIIGMEVMNVEACEKIEDQNIKNHCIEVVDNRIKYCNEGRNDSYCENWEEKKLTVKSSKQ